VTSFSPHSTRKWLKVDPVGFKYSNLNLGTYATGHAKIHAIIKILRTPQRDDPKDINPLLSIWGFGELCITFQKPESLTFSFDFYKSLYQKYVKHSI
jgi:hypothetical protein